MFVSSSGVFCNCFLLFFLGSVLFYFISCLLFFCSFFLGGGIFVFVLFCCFSGVVLFCFVLFWGFGGGLRFITWHADESSFYFEENSTFP